MVQCDSVTNYKLLRTFIELTFINDITSVISTPQSHYWLPMMSCNLISVRHPSSWSVLHALSTEPHLARNCCCCHSSPRQSDSTAQRFNNTSAYAPVAIYVVHWQSGAAAWLSLSCLQRSISIWVTSDGAKHLRPLSGVVWASVGLFCWHQLQI